MEMPMDCQRIQENLSAWLDGELPPAEMETLRRHLAECAACRQVADELRSVAALLKNARRQAAPPELAEEVQSRLERDMLLSPVAEEPEIVAKIDRSLARERSAWWPRVAALAACLALVIAIAALWPRHEAPVVSPPQPEVAMVPSDHDGGSRRALPAEAAKRAEIVTKAGEHGEAAATESLRDAGRKDEKGGTVLGVLGTVTEAKPAEAVDQLKTAAAFENRLVLTADSDPAAAAREMDEVLADAGIHNLTQRPAALPKPTAMPGRALRTSAGRPTETIVYTGTLSTVELSNLNVQVAQNGTFTVTPHSNGAFAQLPVAQNSFRLRNNFQQQNSVQANAANVTSGSAFAYNSGGSGVTGLGGAAGPPAAPAAATAAPSSFGFGSANLATSGMDKTPARAEVQAPAEFPVVIEVQARRQQSP
jgi:anti-sigma factor (TIGR02949 family)